MKYYLPLMLLISGCAQIWVDEKMQPDSSYKISADGNGPASIEQVKIGAYQRAELLCPKGYEKKSEIPEDNIKPSYILIVQCK